MKKTHLALSLCLITSMAGSALGQELIVNGGFEFGSKGWITSSIDSYGGWIATGGVPGGMFRLNDSGQSTDPTILQQVSTLPWRHYLLTGSYKKDIQLGCWICPSFAVDFNGYSVFTSTAEAPAAWRNFSVEVVATGTSAEVRLRGETNGSDTDWEVDNISLVPVISCLGDITGDHFVDSVDLAIVLGAWGSSGGEFGADINQDGIVNAADLAMVLGAWGVCYQ